MASSARLHAAEKALKHTGEMYTRISASMTGVKLDPMDGCMTTMPNGRSRDMGRDLKWREIRLLLQAISAAVKLFGGQCAPFALCFEDDMQTEFTGLCELYSSIDRLAQKQRRHTRLVIWPIWLRHRLMITTDVTQHSCRKLQATVCRGIIFPMRTTALLVGRDSGAEEFLKS